MRRGAGQVNDLLSKEEPLAGALCGEQEALGVDALRARMHVYARGIVRVLMRGHVHLFVGAHVRVHVRVQSTCVCVCAHAVRQIIWTGYVVK